MNYIEIVDRLIGPVQPVGETREDHQRYNNLQQMCDLTRHLINNIQGVAKEIDRHEHSIKKAAEYATGFLATL